MSRESKDSDTEPFGFRIESFLPMLPVGRWSVAADKGPALVRPEYA
jgi:hypothetical protein